MDKRIVVVIDAWEADSLYPQAHYVRTLGVIGDRDTETEVLLLENDINTTPFSPAVHACVPPLPWAVSQAELQDPNRCVAAWMLLSNPLGLAQAAHPQKALQWGCSMFMAAQTKRAAFLLLCGHDDLRNRCRCGNHLQHAALLSKAVVRCCALCFEDAARTDAARRRCQPMQGAIVLYLCQV